MSLSPGSRLGPYVIESSIGAGGMGQVYRAKDTRLDRTVALKILPEGFAADSDRVMRFTREAKSLATLNHPNIAQVYDVGREGSQSFIAMEFVDGEDLSVRIQRGAIPLNEALAIARQIAEALATAHDAGIVHRDLKPANIRITHDGAVKVLDFGLAKTAGADGNSSDSSAATMTSPAMTAMGLVLGTAAYMSPEQAKGRPVDRRADVWAFGIVLYEMLTGTVLFGREDITDTLVAVLTHAPDLAKLPASTPPAVKRLIERCLIKDKKLRLDSMSVARQELDHADAPVMHDRPRSKPILAAVLVVAGVILGGGAVSFYASHGAVTSHPIILSLEAPPDATSAFGYGFALSPDGDAVVFAARSSAGIERLWIRRLDQLGARELPGTDEGLNPAWSPDGRSVAFFADSALKRIDIEDGKAQTVCDAPGIFRHASWSAKDEIAWSRRLGARIGIEKVAASGGTPVTFDALGLSADPQWLSNGGEFLYTTAPVNGSTEIWVASADGKSSSRVASIPPNRTEGSFTGIFAYGGGVIFMNRNNTLTAQRFDERAKQVVGQAKPIGPVAGRPNTWFAVVSNGDRVLADATDRGNNGRTRLAWTDRQGNTVGSLGDATSYWQLRLSPDGKSALAVSNSDFLLLRPDLPTVRLTTDGASSHFVNVAGVWSANGTEMVYRQAGQNAILRRPVNSQGTATVVSNASVSYPEDWSTDGRWLMTSGIRGTGTSDDLYLYDFSTKSERPWMDTPFNEKSARFSPDSAWVAYASDVSGRLEIYIRGRDGQSEPVAVSSGGGRFPFWRKDGSELFYLGNADEMMSVPITRSAGAIAAGKPKQLFRIQLSDFPVVFPPYGVTPDGQRFLLSLPDVPNPLFLLQGLGAIVK